MERNTITIDTKKGISINLTYEFEWYDLGPEEIDLNRPVYCEGDKVNINRYADGNLYDPIEGDNVEWDKYGNALFGGPNISNYKNGPEPVLYKEIQELEIVVGDVSLFLKADNIPGPVMDKLADVIGKLHPKTEKVAA